MFKSIMIVSAICIGMFFSMQQDSLAQAKSKEKLNQLRQKK